MTFAKASCMRERSEVQAVQGGKVPRIPKTQELKRWDRYVKYLCSLEESG